MDIHFILDRSGSMYSCIDDTLGGYNSFIDRQKEMNPDGRLSLHIFNNHFNTVYKNQKMSDVPKLTRELYWPQGQTALLDAIGKTIKLVESDNHTTIVILTDGEENFSSTYTKAHVFDLIENKKKTGKWSFIFIGANQDAIKEAGKLGISENNALNFDQEKTIETFECLSNAMSRQVTGETQDIEFTEVDRSMSQRDAHDSASSCVWPPYGPVF